MSGYLVSFTVYTMAMCGLIFFALFVYKKFTEGSLYSKNSKFLNVEDTLSLAPRKTLYVIKAGDERFLVAADMDKTTLISKLNAKDEIGGSVTEMSSTEFKGVDDLPVIVDFPRNAPNLPSHNVSPKNSGAQVNVKKGSSMIMEIVKRIKE